MKYLFFILLAVIVDPTKIGKVNAAKSKAKESFLRGEYQAAATQYRILTDSLGVNEDEVRLNLAHSYFHLNDTAQAQNSYLSLTNSTDRNIKSVSLQQLGVMANRQGKFEEALNHFKNALKANPSNEEARYNYEMLKKKLEEKKKQEQQEKDQQQKDQKNKDQKDNKEKKDQEKKDQEKKDQQQKDQEKQDQEKKDQEQKDQQQKEQEQKEQSEKKDDKNPPPNVSEKLKEMKISEEKAKMVLEALKNQEIQYLQQNKRKATKPRSKGKPDW